MKSKNTDYWYNFERLCKIQTQIFGLLGKIVANEITDSQVITECEKLENKINNLYFEDNDAEYTLQFLCYLKFMAIKS